MTASSGMHPRRLLPMWSAAILLGLGCGSGNVSGPTADAAQDVAPTIEQALNREIEEAMGRGHYPGAAAGIVRAGQLVWSGAWGLADVARETPVARNTIFMLASVSKTVTTLTALHAVEAGLVDLDADVQTYLAFPVRRAGSTTAITLRHLLTHSSGIHDDGNFIWNQYVFGADATESLATYLERFLSPTGANYAAANFATEAGTAWEYSNIGFALVGLVIERATRTDFAEYSRLHILAPLDMSDSSWFLAGVDASRTALPYQWENRRFVTRGHYGYADYPDGQLRSTVADLARVEQLVLGNGAVDGRRILAQATMNEMQRRQGPGGSNGQALGWHWAGTSQLGHSGGDLGVSTNLVVRPRDGTGIILLCNGQASDRDAFDEMTSALFAYADRL